MNAHLVSQVTVYHLEEGGGDKEGGGGSNAAGGGGGGTNHSASAAAAENKGTMGGERGHRKKTVGTHTSYMSCCLFPGSDNQVGRDNAIRVHMTRFGHGSVHHM